MNRRRLLGMSVFVVTFLSCTTVVHAGTQEQPSGTESGTHLIKICGCNDCHTPGWPESNGTLPEKDWLTGVPVGWNGPWGTTYAGNLRIFINRFTENEWVNFARSAQLRPPMPWWVLNYMSEDEIRTIYHKVKELGPTGVREPDYVAPDAEPTTPFILFVPQSEGQKKQKE